LGIFEDEVDLSRFDSEVFNKFLLVIEDFLDIVEELVWILISELESLITFNFLAILKPDGLESHPRVEKVKLPLEITDNFLELILSFYDLIEVLRETSECDYKVLVSVLVLFILLALLVLLLLLVLLFLLVLENNFDLFKLMRNLQFEMFYLGLQFCQFYVLSFDCVDVKDRDHLSYSLLNLFPAINNSVGYFNFLFGK
jgi:hypothetical protein